MFKAQSVAARKRVMAASMTLSSRAQQRFMVFQPPNEDIYVELFGSKLGHEQIVLAETLTKVSDLSVFMSRVWTVLSVVISVGLLVWVSWTTSAVLVSFGGFCGCLHCWFAPVLLLSGWGMDVRSWAPGRPSMHVLPFDSRWL